MADYTKTITESVTMLGMSDANLWGTFLWGELWGSSEDLRKEFDQAPLGNSVTLTDALGKDFVRDFITNNIAMDDPQLSSIMRAWGIWDYVFTKPTTDGDEKIFDQFSKVSDGSTSWTKTTDGSTSWTKL